MATGYDIKFTDQTRSFQIAPYSTNGPANPNDDNLHAQASSAATTLLLFGKGTPDYGDKKAENDVNMLEHFASDVEPVRPIGGQIWYDRSVIPDQLRVYNLQKNEIFADSDNPGMFNWLALDPADAAEEAAMLARFVTGFRIRIFQSGTDTQEEYLIQTSATVNGSGLVAFQTATTPAASRVGWFAGGWEYLIQNNTPLRENWDVGGVFRVKNMPDPVDPQDAATQAYVDAAAAGGTLGTLLDVTITTPVDNDILVYDSGLPGWKNVAASGVYLAVAGGTMTGTLNMGTNQIENLADPRAGGLGQQDAATRIYVDNAVPSSINDLSDVIVTAPAAGSLLQWNGAVWTNITAPSFIATNNILTTSGGTLIDDLILNADPTLGLGAATKDYVDSSIVGANDGVVDGVIWNPTTNVLTLTRTIALPNLDVTLSSITTTTDNISHVIVDPNTNSLIPSDAPGLAWERLFYSSTTYPVVAENVLQTSLSVALGKLTVPKGKLVFATNGSAVVNLASGGPIAGQANPTLPRDFDSYAVASNRLSVYVAGVKHVASERGYQDVTAVGTGSPAPVFRLFHGTETGLTPLTTYDFGVAVNGGANTTINITTPAGVYRLGDLMDDINTQTDSLYHDSGTPNALYAFGATIQHGVMRFYSSIPGTASSIALTDGGINPALFAAMTGNISTTGLFSINLPLSGGPTNLYAPVNYGYNELGRAGRESKVFQFIGTIPVVSTIIEVIVEPDLFVEP